ncbi:MAG: NeuD/PglB/VioB family sugar acetyltransferase [Pontixanthobacter sp.]
MTSAGGIADSAPWVFWGHKGQAVVLRDIVRSHGNTLMHFVSDDELTEFEGLPVTPWEQFRATVKESLPPETGYAVAIGGPHGAARLERLRILDEHDCGLRPLIHPTAAILSNAKLGLGNQICARAVVGVNAVLGAAVIVNTGATVDHDCTIGDGCHIAPGTVILGRVTIGECVFVGANATILPDLTIESHVTIGAGAVVLSDIDRAGTYVGSPAKRIGP